MGLWDFPFKDKFMGMRLEILLLFFVLIVGAGLYRIFKPPKGTRAIAPNRVVRSQPWDTHGRIK